MIIDTFPAFMTYWAEVQGRSLDDQIEGWAAGYLAPWPELLEKQVETYRSENVDWRQVARERVFPYLPERLEAMQRAHANLLALCEPIYARAQRRLGFEGAALFVIHVGIGCGAGWATRFRDSPAVLFGLEAVAECGWSEPRAITSLVAHEVGHLVHHGWRARAGKPIGSGPWWQLYEEGFAQRCSCLVVERDCWHQARDDADWLDWCRRNQGWLAAEYLRTVAAGRPVTKFFGSWHDIMGRSETGYALGYQTILELEESLDLKEIALLEEIEGHLRPVLEQIKASDGAAGAG